MKILQDLENKRETRDSRKRARRAPSAGGISRVGSSRGLQGGAGARAGTLNALTPTRADGGLGPYANAVARYSAARRSCGTCETRSRDPPLSASAGSSRGCGPGLICTQHRHSDVVPTTLSVLHFSLTLRFLTDLVTIANRFITFYVNIFIVIFFCTTKFERY